jgi:hypothetical protein
MIPSLRLDEVATLSRAMPLTPIDVSVLQPTPV